MSVPEFLQSLIDTLLSEVRGNLQHQMSSYRRRELYDTFEISTEAAIQRAPRWLAVITAKRVLPIFQQKYPDDSLPQQLVDTAIGVLYGQVDDAKATEMMEVGYQASAAFWGYDEREIPWPVCQAGNASYWALSEACGHQPLSCLTHDYYRGDVLTPWTDEYLCEFWPDAAAAAAIAVASDPYGRTFDSGELLTFWTWWLTEAIPQSIEVAHCGRFPAGGQR